MKDFEMWKEYGQNGVFESWSFGCAADKLAALVLEGKKRATSSARVLYDAEGEALPKAGDYSVILDSAGEAVCIVRNVSVEVIPYRDVTEEMASLEGEGDLSLEYWREVHEDFFKDELSPYGIGFNEGMEVVFEVFEKVYPCAELKND